MVQWTNAWWRGGPKAVAVNLSKRTAWSTFNMIVVVKQIFYIVLVLLGVALLFLSWWLVATTQEQTEKWRKPLRDIDEFIDDSIDGLNFVTQTIPAKVVEFANTSIVEVQRTGQTVIEFISKTSEQTVNGMLNGIEESLNKVANFVPNPTPPPSLDLPSITVNIPSYSVSYNIVQPVDTTAVRIPPRNFSVEEIVGEFLDEAAETLYTVADYMFIISIVLLCFVCLLLFIACIDPWVPRVDNTNSSLKSRILCKIIKCPLLFAMGIAGAIRRLLSPIVFFPVGVGLLIVLVLSPTYDEAVDVIDENIRIPLVEFDEFMGEYIYRPINNVTQRLPPLVINAANDGTGAICNDLDLAFTALTNDMLFNLNGAFDDLVFRIRQFMQSVRGSLQLVNTFRLSPNFLGLTRLGRFIPEIPMPDLDSLLIEEDQVSVKRKIDPWLDQRMAEMRDVGETFFLVGLLLVILPGLLVLASCLYPFVPRPINQFFLRPEYKEDPKPSKKSKEAPEDKELMSPVSGQTSAQPSMQTSPNRSSINVSEPRLQNGRGSVNMAPTAPAPPYSQTSYPGYANSPPPLPRDNAV